MKRHIVVASYDQYRKNDTETNRRFDIETGDNVRGDVFTFNVEGDGNGGTALITSEGYVAIAWGADPQWFIEPRDTGDVDEIISRAIEGELYDL